jgi:hypothetical protein
MTGFTDQEISLLISKAMGTADGLTDPDAVPQTPEEPITKPGDLWLLGTYTTCPHCGEVNE